MALRHLEIGDQWRRSEAYRPKPKSIPPYRIPPQPREQHGAALLEDAQRVRERFAEVSRHWVDKEHITAKGLIVEFESVPGVVLATEGWSDRTIPKYDLLNERVTIAPDGKEIVIQRWFIRDGALDEFVRVFKEYLEKNTPKGEPKRRPLVDSIRRLQVAALDALWTDLTERPADGETDWYEVWLRAGAGDDERNAILNQFKTEAEQNQLEPGKWAERLPEHTVVHVSGPFGHFGHSVALMNCIAEIRRVGEYADFYDNLAPQEQRRHVDNLLGRLRMEGDGSLAVCVLDTGVERGHPLLEPLIPPAANQTINAAWGTADDQDHGTPMSGLAAYGNLTEVLAQREPVDVPFALEAVKIVPPKAILNTDEKHAGEYTAQGVAIAEAARPNRTRVWCLATSMDEKNDGRPSSWSSRVDQLAAGVDNGGETRRMICVSAGNVPVSEWNDYPRANDKHPIQNPGQAWNALCVGSCTELHRLSQQTQDQGYRSIASQGGMAPCNRTSVPWVPEWPTKPDIVLEGGNAAAREQRDLPYQAPELLLLSTEAGFRDALFRTFDGTSAATALAARMAAHIVHAYPDYWPETIRGLMVHSAEWTAAMEAAIPWADAHGARFTERQRLEMLVRMVGLGKPEIGRALGGQPNRATLISQAVLQPFKSDDTGAKYNQYDVYTLPWPQTGLQRFYEHDVRMRVTLSYFIEPNPGNRVTTRYRYPGCRLKFRVSSPGQTVEDLKAEINKYAADEAQQTARPWLRGDNNGWKLGPQRVFKGSIHTDIWEGSAAQLLSMKHIAVYPTAGWWKTRLGLKRADSQIRYSLIVTLEAPDLEVDLYAEIANQIAVPIVLEGARP